MNYTITNKTRRDYRDNAKYFSYGMFLKNTNGDIGIVSMTCYEEGDSHQVIILESTNYIEGCALTTEEFGECYALKNVEINYED